MSQSEPRQRRCFHNSRLWQCSERSAMHTNRCTRHSSQPAFSVPASVKPALAHAALHRPLVIVVVLYE